MEEDEDLEKTGGSASGGEKMSEAEIDHNLMGTFPASDPPSWTLGTYHRDESLSTPEGQPARAEDED